MTSENKIKLKALLEEYGRDLANDAITNASIDRGDVISSETITDWIMDMDITETVQDALIDELENQGFMVEDRDEDG